jgi:basic membrane protein A
MTVRLLACCLLACATLAVPAEELRVALLCTGSVTDGGWNQLAKDGIDRLAKQSGAKVTVLQKVAQDKAGDEMRAFAADGYDLVIAHGYEYLNPATEVAKAGGKTRFAVSGADVASPGIVTIDFDVSQASYQVGILAARLSKTGKLGFIGGAPIPSVKACYRGFLAGAQSVDPAITVAETYTSWDQPQQSKAQAEALLEQGRDVLYQDVDAAGRGVFEAIAARNAKAPGSAWVFGCVADQNANPICANAMPASAVIRIENAFAHVLDGVKAGTFKPGLVKESLAAGTCVLVLNPALVGSVVTPAMQAEVEAAGKKLAAGGITIPQ